MTGIVNSTGARSGIIGTTVGTPAGLTEETGTFTPVLSSATGSLGTITSAGQYVKIGELVLITLHHIIGGTESGAGTSCISMSGLPFTKKSGSSLTVTPNFGYSDGISGDPFKLSWMIQSGATSGFVLSNHTADVLTANRIPVGVELYLSFTYQVN